MMFPIKNRTFEQILGFSISEMYYFSPRPTVNIHLEKKPYKLKILIYIINLFYNLPHFLVEFAHCVSHENSNWATLDLAIKKKN